MERLFEDIRFGFRSLRANPTFSFIAVLTLAMGIGVTTAMFTLVNSVLLKPLPFPNAEELVYVNSFNKKKNELDGVLGISFVEQLRDTESPLQDIGYFAYDQATLGKGDQQLPLTLLITSSNYLSLYGVEPQLGRVYQESDVNAQTIIISHDVWQEHFNGDPDILSRTIQLNKQDFSVIGVMPENYSNTGYTSTSLWMPINDLDRPVQVIARMNSGLSPEQAKQQSTAIQRLINQVRGDTENVWEIHYTSQLEQIVDGTRTALYLLLAAVSAVFLIAVLNVVNLSFAQYANRSQELAVRVSVGASRGRLLRQLLTESVLLCTIGGVIGMLMAAWSMEWIRHLMGSRLPRLHEIGLDQSTVLVVLALISVSAIATTLIPAYSIVNPKKLTDAIKQAGRKVTSDRNSQKVRRLLVSSEVAIAVVLLISAGLLMRSYVNLADQDTGFNSENVVTGHIWLADNFKPQPSRAGYWLRVAEALKEIPGVTAVAATSTMPMGRTGIDYPVNYSYPSAPTVERGEEPSAFKRTITPGYFSLLEIPLLAGRDFDFRDTSESPKVVIINQFLAEKNWPNQDPIGNVLILPEWMGGNHTVVGVVGNVKHRGLRAVPNPEFFIPVTQYAFPGLTYMVKTNSQDFGAIKQQMYRTSVNLEATAPMIQRETLSELTTDSITGERILLVVLAAFAGVALLLASIGVYGISDNMVSQRTNEIGIRMAIGARPKVIRRWIIRDTSRPVLLGAVIGVIFAFISGQLIASILYGVNVVDPLTFVFVPGVLMIVGIVATWIPATRATKVHPQHALHYE